MAGRPQPITEIWMIFAEKLNYQFITMPSTKHRTNKRINRSYKCYELSAHYAKQRHQKKRKNKLICLFYGIIHRSVTAHHAMNKKIPHPICVLGTNVYGNKSSCKNFLFQLNVTMNICVIPESEMRRRRKKMKKIKANKTHRHSHTSARASQQNKLHKMKNFTYRQNM